MSEAVVTNSPFGPRKLRPPPADSSGNGNATAAPPSVTSSANEPSTLVGVRKVRQPPPAAEASPPAAAVAGVTESPFGPRKFGGGSTNPGIEKIPQAEAQQSSPFGARLRPAGGGSTNAAPQENATTAASSPFGARLRAPGGGPQPSPASSSVPTTKGATIPEPPAPAKPAEPPMVEIVPGRRVPLINLERIEAAILTLRSQRNRHSLQLVAHIALIQQEYRAFLAAMGATFEVRSRKRAAAKQLLLSIQQEAKELALVARERGALIAREEDRSFRQLFAAACGPIFFKTVSLNEATRRANILKEETESFSRKFAVGRTAPDSTKSALVGVVQEGGDENYVIPACLRPGVERDEMILRSHGMGFEVFERRKLLLRETAERAAVMLKDEQAIRRDTLQEEALARLQALRVARLDHSSCRILEALSMESRFRSVIERQWAQFLSTATRTSAGRIALMLIESEQREAEGGGGGGGEGSVRRAIRDREHFYWSLLMKEFHEKRIFLTFVACQREEHRLRCGAGGIIAQERNARQVIHVAMIKGLLCRVQGSSDLCDPSTEAGGRCSLEIAEARERRSIERFLSQEALQLFFPPIEARQRSKISEAEASQRQGIVREMGVLPIMFMVLEEPSVRKRLIAEWQAGMVRLMYQYAILHAQRLELAQRVRLMQLEEAFFERMLAFHYLSRVEAAERKSLRKGVKALHRRARAETLQAYSAASYYRTNNLSDTSPLRLLTAQHEVERFRVQHLLPQGDGSPQRMHSSPMLSPPAREGHRIDPEAYVGTPFYERMSQEAKQMSARPFLGPSSGHRLLDSLLRETSSDWREPSAVPLTTMSQSPPRAEMKATHLRNASPAASRSRLSSSWGSPGQ